MLTYIMCFAVVFVSNLLFAWAPKDINPWFISSLVALPFTVFIQTLLLNNEKAKVSGKLLLEFPVDGYFETYNDGLRNEGVLIIKTTQPHAMVASQICKQVDICYFNSSPKESYLIVKPRYIFEMSRKLEFIPEKHALGKIPNKATLVSYKATLLRRLFDFDALFYPTTYTISVMYDGTFAQS